MPTDEARPTRYSIRLWPGSRKRRRFNFSESPLAGRTFEAVIAELDLDLELSIVGDLMTIVFAVPEDTPVGRLDWVLWETTGGHREPLLAGQLHLGNKPTEDQDGDETILVIPGDATITVTVLGEPGPAGHDAPSDHGLLDGLADDDHPQYHTDARGDARYPSLAALAAEVADRQADDTAIANDLADEISRALAIEAAKADLVAGKVPDAQIPAAITRDSELATEVAALVGADGDLADLIAAEVSRALAVEAAKADLVGGKVPTSQMAAITTNERRLVANQAARLALANPADVQPGDVAIQADIAETFLLVDTDPSLLASWKAIDHNAVASVNGQVGTVVLGYADVGAASTTDARLSDTRVPTDNTVSTAKLQARSVTWAKVQAMATAKLLGRATAGSGDVEELTPAQTKTLLAIVAGDISDFAAQAIAATSGTYVLPISTMSVLRAAAGAATGTTRNLLGYYASGDGGGGNFYWDAASTATDNGGTIIAVTGVAVGRWLRVWSDHVDVRWFGAVGDEITDDTAAIQAAIGVGALVVFPRGVFLVTNLVVNALTGMRFIGASQARSVLKTASADLFTLTSATKITFEHMRCWSAAGGGHIFNITNSLSHGLWFDMTCQQDNDAKSVLNIDDTSDGAHGANYIDNLWLHVDTQHKLTATVPTFCLKGGAINRNRWIDIRPTFSGNYTWWIETTASGSYASDNVIEGITAEVLDGGIVKLLGCRGTRLSDIGIYDLGTSVVNLIHLGNAVLTSTLKTSETTLQNIRRAGTGIGSGLFDVKLAGSGSASGATFIDCGGSTALTVDANSQTFLQIGGNVTVTNSSAMTRLIESRGLLSRQIISDQTGTTYTPVLADETTLVRLSNAAAITVTLPQDSDLAIPVGGRIDFVQKGAGQVTYAAGTGATVNATPGYKHRAQYSAVTAEKVEANTWLLVGDLAA